MLVGPRRNCRGRPKPWVISSSVSPPLPWERLALPYRVGSSHEKRDPGWTMGFLFHYWEGCKWHEKSSFLSCCSPFLDFLTI